MGFCIFVPMLCNIWHLLTLEQMGLIHLKWCHKANSMSDFFWFFEFWMSLAYKLPQWNHGKSKEFQSPNKFLDTNSDLIIASKLMNCCQTSLFACWMGISNPKNTLIWRSPFHLLKAWDQRKHISTLILPHSAS